MGLNLQAIRGSERFSYLAIEARQRGEDGDVIVVEPHFHFVIHGGPMRSYFIGLPQTGYFGQHKFFQSGHILLRHWDAIQCGQKFANAPPLEHHRTPRHFRRMRGEDGNN